MVNFVFFTDIVRVIDNGDDDWWWGDCNEKEVFKFLVWFSKKIINLNAVGI